MQKVDRSYGMESKEQRWFSYKQWIEKELVAERTWYIRAVPMPHIRTLTVRFTGLVCER